MNNKIIIAAVYLSLAGCTSPTVSSHLAAGAIGCLSNDIKISNEDYTLATDSNEFIAECNGKKFVCTYINKKGFDAATPATCHPLLTQDKPVEQKNAEDCANRRRYNSTLVCPQK
jgi:hypothetical protein